MLGLSLTLSGTVGVKNLWQVKISFFLSFECILICPNFIYLFVLENYCEEKFYVRSSPLSQSIFICEKFLTVIHQLCSRGRGGLGSVMYLLG